MHDGSMFFILCVALIVSGVVLVLASMLRRQKIVEMAHKERMALIERGLPPGPATDPAPFGHGRLDPIGERRSRMLSGGIVVIALGLALMLLIGVAGGASESAMGVGGAIAIIGAAFVVIALVQRHAVPPPPPFSPPPFRRDGEM